jgi:prevent-host-death family protein
MPRTVSSSEAQNNFGAMVQWAEETNDEVIIERRGKPIVAIISYDEYQKLAELRELERKRQIFEELEAVRRRVRGQNSEITAEQAYRRAGFTEEVIADTLPANNKLAEE